MAMLGVVLIVVQARPSIRPCLAARPGTTGGATTPRAGWTCACPCKNLRHIFSNPFLQLVNPNQHSAVIHAARMPITANPVRFTGFAATGHMRYEARNPSKVTQGHGSDAIKCKNGEF